MPVLAMLYNAVGAGRGWAAGGALVFCRAMLASASRMDEPLETGAVGAVGADAGGPVYEASTCDGGLPGGVVD